MKTYLFLLLFFSGLMFTSCSKEEHAIVGSWKVIAYETRSNTSPNWEASSETCRLDDTEQYDADGRWTRYDGTNQCSAGTGILKGTYTIQANNTKIIYQYDDFEGEYESTIESLTNDEFVISWSAGTTDNLQFRATFKRI